MDNNKQLSTAVNKALSDDDNKRISLTVNGEKLEDINPEGEDVPELRKNKIQYDKYDNLTDLFVEGLVHFSKFISMSVPDDFKKDDPDEQELHSSRSGVTAYNKCMKLLQRQMNTGKTGYKKPHDFKKLSEWYVNGIIDFMGITMSDVPDNMIDQDDDDYVVKCAIEAFKRVKRMLQENIKEVIDAE